MANPARFLSGASVDADIYDGLHFESVTSFDQQIL
jgi:hypothetical protein